MSLKTIAHVCFMLPLLLGKLQAEWSSPIDISSRFWDVSNAINSSGNATVIWADWAWRTLYTSNLRKGHDQYWSHPDPFITVPSKHQMIAPKIVLDGNWNAIAIWEEYDEVHSISTVKAAMRPYLGVWTASVEVSNHIQHEPDTSLDDYSPNPSLAITSSGYAVAIWQNKKKANVIVQAATVQFGEPWSNPVNLSHGSNPQVKIDEAGNALAVWINNGMVQSSTLAVGKKWSTPVNVGQGAAPQLAMNPSGYAMVAWFANSAYAATKQVGENWSTPTLIEHSTDDVEFAGQECVAALDVNGNGLVAWIREDLDNASVYPIFLNRYIQAAYLPYQGSWSMPVNVSSKENFAKAYNPQIAFDQWGNAVAVWNTYTNIVTSTLPLHGTWSEAINLSQGPYGIVSKPQLVLDPSGYGVVNFSTDYGNVQGVQRFSDE